VNLTLMREMRDVWKKRSVLHFVVQDVLGTAANNAQKASFLMGRGLARSFYMKKVHPIFPFH